MLSKTIKPKTKYELISALQKAQFSKFQIFEGTELDKLLSKAQLNRLNATVLILHR